MTTFMKPAPRRSTCRRCLCLLASVLGTLSAVAAHAAADAQADNPVLCKWTPPEWGERAQVRCPLQLDAHDRKLRLSAVFLGSHDDTRLSLRVVFGQSALPCAAGNKQESNGEEGDGGKVVLECRFAVPIDPGSTPELVVHVEWHHAQPMGFVLAIDP